MNTFSSPIFGPFYRLLLYALPSFCRSVGLSILCHMDREDDAMLSTSWTCIALFTFMQIIIHGTRITHKIYFSQVKEGREERQENFCWTSFHGYHHQAKKGKNEESDEHNQGYKVYIMLSTVNHAFLSILSYFSPSSFSCQPLAVAFFASLHSLSLSRNRCLKLNLLSKDWRRGNTLLEE